MDLQEILDTVRAWPTWVTYTALWFGAFIEYVFPPFPGDMVVVAGAVLVTAFGWNLWPVLALITAGSILGALCDLWFGRWLHRTGRIARLRPSWQEAIDGISRQFVRRGPLYLVMNRFVPGVRAFFFIAAGVAGLRAPAVALWAGLSALLWNALLLLAGWLLGDNIAEIEALLTRYSVIVLSVVAVVVAVLIWRFVRARRLKSRQAEASRSRTEGSDQT